MSMTDLFAFVVSDFWRFLGATIIMSMVGSGVFNLIDVLRMTPEQRLQDRMQKRLLEHEKEQAEKIREHEKEMGELRRE